MKATELESYIFDDIIYTQNQIAFLTQNNNK